MERCKCGIIKVYRAKYSPLTASRWWDNASRFREFEKELTQLLLCVIRWRTANQIWVVSGRLIVNGVLFAPRLPSAFVKRLPYDTQRFIKQGKYAMLVDFAMLSEMRKLTYIKIDDVEFCYRKMALDLDIGEGWGYTFDFELKTLFDKIPSLKVLEVESRIMVA